MISGYLHLKNWKDQFGAFCAPFGVMTLFGVIFLAQIFFLPNFLLSKFLCYPNFFFTQIFLPQIFFFFNFFLGHFFFFFFLLNYFFNFFFAKLNTGDIYVACCNHVLY